VFLRLLEGGTEDGIGNFEIAHDLTMDGASGFSAGLVAVGWGLLVQRASGFRRPAVGHGTDPRQWLQPHRVGASRFEGHYPPRIISLQAAQILHRSTEIIAVSSRDALPGSPNLFKQGVLHKEILPANCVGCKSRAVHIPRRGTLVFRWRGMGSRVVKWLLKPKHNFHGRPLPGEIEQRALNGS
jgi:hypothetical protein